MQQVHMEDQEFCEQTTYVSTSKNKQRGLEQTLQFWRVKGTERAAQGTDATYGILI